jgi:hypothetical protein
MPIKDYNKKKKLEVSSTNDSGTTQDKAQPILLRGNDFTGIDGFESGSSQLNWESTTNYTIDSNSEISGNNSLQISSSNSSGKNASRSLDSTINSDGKTILFKIKIDNQTGNQSDSVSLKGTDTGTDKITINFNGDGSLNFNGSSTSFNWSSGVIYDVEIKVDFSNNEADLIIDDQTVVSNEPLATPSINPAQVDTFVLNNDTSYSGAAVNAFFDRLTYTASAEDSINSGGDIGVDFTNISDAQDIAVYDQNGNLLDYEIESLDTAAETGVIWAYDDWVRDDTVQAQVAYGNNSSNTDRQNVTATWGNTGQNTVMVQHLQDEPLTATDSTSNNNDGAVNGAVSTSGQFNGAGSFGFDDFIEVPDSSSIDVTGSLTLVSWVNFDRLTNSGETFWYYNIWGGNSSQQKFLLRLNDANIFDFFITDQSNTSKIDSGVTPNTGEDNHIVGRWNAGTSFELFINSISEAQSSTLLSPSSTSQPLGLGARLNPDENFLEGDMDAVRYFSENKTNDWIQADFDASPKAGQVYFSQQAAEATVTNQTVTVPETQTTSTNPDPQINATVDVSVPTSTATTVNPAPTVSPGAAPLNLTASTASTANPDFTVQPGKTNVQTPVSTATVSNPDPAVNAFNEITVPETTAVAVNPAPSLTVGQTILTPETTVASSNPDLTVQPGETSLNISTTQVSASNPVIGLNRQIVVGVATNLESENPEPNLQAGAVSVQVPETTILTDNPALLVQPGATSLQTEQATSLQTVNPDFNTVAGAAELQVSETQLTASIQEPSIGLTLQFVSPTNALITNDERFFDMPDHTFTEGDLGDTLTATLKDDASPDGVDLTGATEIRLVVKDRDGVKVFDKEMSLADSSNGDVEYKWGQGDFIEEPGVYRSKIKVFDSTGEPESFPNDGFRTIEVEEEIG